MCVCIYCEYYPYSYVLWWCIDGCLPWSHCSTSYDVYMTKQNILKDEQMNNSNSNNILIHPLVRLMIEAARNMNDNIDEQCK